MPSSAATSAHHRLPVARAVRDPRAEARRRGSRRGRPRRTTSRPAARPTSSSRELGEVDPGAAGERVVGRRARRRACRRAAPRGGSGCRRGRGAARALHAEDHVDVAARRSERDRLGRLGLVDAQRRRRGAVGAQRPRGRREQPGERGREAADPHLAARRRRPARRGRPPAARAARTARRRARAARARRA